VEELQAEGAGPQTVGALKELAARSAKLAAPRLEAQKPVYVTSPPPSSEDQARIIDATRGYAMNHSHSWPNYICAQVTRRFYDPTGNEEWRPADIIMARLTYFEQEEDYKLIT